MAEYQTNEACVCCGQRGLNMVCLHHLYTRKVYPEFKNKPWNQMPLCQQHHNEAHSKGSIFMASTYLGFKRWLVDNDWEICSYAKKWQHVGHENKESISV